MWTKKPDITHWEKVVHKIGKIDNEVTIAVVGKYVSHKDAYKSLHEALEHSGLYSNSTVNIKYVDSEDIEEKGVKEFLSNVDGVLVPGGFGSRGFEGKIKAVEYARVNKIPFFGICLGMQMAVIEYSRNVCKIKNANTSEIGNGIKNPVIHLMESQKNVNGLGGTMRLGAYPCKLKKGSLAYKAYDKNKISERHRHRFEFNNDYREKLESEGMVLCGVSPDNHLVEIVELKDHPWFLGCQFHPEFKSTPLNPHPLFREFVKSSLTHKKSASKN